MLSWTMHHVTGAVIGLAGLLLAAAAGADTVDSLIIGGLELRSDDRIAIAEQDLSISRAEIRARYSLRNQTDRDVEAMVAFPLPSFDMEDVYGMELAGLQSETYDPVAFRLWIDGAAAQPELLVRATVEGRDVAPLLDRYAIPYSPHHPAFHERWSALSPDAIAALTEAGAARADGNTIWPLWRFEAAYQWQQLFPAKAAVVIEHAHTPIVSGNYVSLRPDEAGQHPALKRTGYCLDAATEAAVRKRLDETPKDAQGYGSASVWYLDYALTTARSWSGPIGQFGLTVDTTDAGNILAWCEEGRSSGPTTFAVRHADYAPAADLHLMIMEFPGRR